MDKRRVKKMEKKSINLDVEKVATDQMSIKILNEKKIQSKGYRAPDLCSCSVKER